jgi:hypothetical protein
MSQPVVQTAFDRAGLVRRGRKLEYLTIARNSLEAIIAVMTPIIAKEGLEALRGEACCDDVIPA